MDNTIKKIKNQIETNPIVLYMKGTPSAPKCGFSSKAAQILSTHVQSFFYIDVLIHIDIRNALPTFSNWPTFPQLWIEGKLIGGSDIMINMSRNGKLHTLINQVKLRYNLN
ncbi:Grx4 family monothiol glutaredoxin [Blochmannia endosymbiont of Camponotus sp. C-046]|uniref:Grx4 family monothiol glutaredoxin n=1 Tax=Blochmannia endosymbiont of Camponotus sp. C-046 TaxID=2945589 RepID=UPI002024C581|nr:Grx4 family monothiol glutaredoxin [Blochmannia endosymbiont of Camponotus sp. C-046]URJ28921.1 Grx4 family monothiol glutaredoxin [Blochmannia endosymbiont of Camponotus sp. C-046]